MNLKSGCSNVHTAGEKGHIARILSISDPKAADDVIPRYKLPPSSRSLSCFVLSCRPRNSRNRQYSQHFFILHFFVSFSLSSILCHRLHLLFSLSVSAFLSHRFYSSSLCDPVHHHSHQFSASQCYSQFNRYNNMNVFHTFRALASY